ncbi:EamA family transporter [Herminiimonas sp. KBW02]|uniref:DMT family transporter n=1 Tax=Herminiimonas sp. KBW02 TaxID=2153363 RepID=UPI000F5A30FE|nr:DMT family transporter [Herminiimonas sp. KBW02]RQO32776.1 EamA family transporter [Herminiimonas sp. KBW02]
MQSLWMLVATLMFSIMGVCVKLASETYSVAEIIMYRGFIGVIFIYILILQQGGSLRTHLIWQHLWRCVVGVTALWLWFCAIGLLPLATAMTLNYMAPIWISGILFVAAWRAGKRRFEWGLVLAITASFVGVTLLLRPSIHADQWLGGFLGVCSGALSALAYLQVRHLGQLGEPESRVVFYFSATGFIAGLGGCLFGPGLHGESISLLRSHSTYGIFLLLSIGVFAAIAQMAMTRAYRLGNTLVTANLQYTGIVFSSIWGVLIWSDILGFFSWLGIAIILVSGIVATFYNIRNSATVKAVTPADPISTEL